MGIFPLELIFYDSIISIISFLLMFHRIWVHFRCKKLISFFLQLLSNDMCIQLPVFLFLQAKRPLIIFPLKNVLTDNNFYFHTTSKLPTTDL